MAARSSSRFMNVPRRRLKHHRRHHDVLKEIKVEHETTKEAREQRRKSAHHDYRRQAVSPSCRTTACTEKMRDIVSS